MCRQPPSSLTFHSKGTFNTSTEKRPAVTRSFLPSSVGHQLGLGKPDTYTQPGRCYCPSREDEKSQKRGNQPVLHTWLVQKPKPTCRHTLPPRHVLIMPAALHPSAYSCGTSSCLGGTRGRLLLFVVVIEKKVLEAPLDRLKKSTRSHNRKSRRP